MKKLFALTIILALLFVTTAPALAAGGPPTGGMRGGNAPFALAGTIASLDPATHTVTVTVACGNKLVKSSIGQNLTLQTNAVTRFLLRNPDGSATAITYEELAVGQKVSINGRLANNVWTASRITVGAKLTCLP